MALQNPTNHSVFRMALGKKKKKYKTAKHKQKDNRDMTFDKLGCLASLF